MKNSQTSKLLISASVAAAVVAWACDTKPDVGEACQMLPGDLVISEVMAEPADNCDSHPTRGACEGAEPPCNWSVSDTCGVVEEHCSSTDKGREWIEVYNATSQLLDLNRLAIRRLTLQTCEQEGCRHDTCPDPMTCGDDKKCHSGIRCDDVTPCAGQMTCSANGLCELSGTCTTDEECPDGMLCGKCGNCECNAADACSGGQYCDSAADCRCQTDADCPRVGQTCDANKVCQCPTCNDGQCPSDMRCGDDNLCHDTSESVHFVRGASPVASRDRFVFGDGAEPFVDYSWATWGESLGGLNSTDAEISLLCKETLVDAIWYGREGGPPEPRTGFSLTFDQGVGPDSILNDDGQYWCVATGDTYDALGLNVGSPGAENTTLCGKGTCLDGLDMREVVSAQVGDLVITEVYADAVGADAGKEWLEVYNAGTASFDLNGSLVYNESEGGSGRSVDIVGVECASISAGEYGVIGASRELADNGNVVVGILAEGLTLYNGGLLQVRSGRGVLDGAQYPVTSEGVSVGLDPLRIGDTENDDVETFCASRTTGTFEGTGTPGSVNDLCGNACWEGTTPRLVNAPGVGDLVITEVYPDPDGTDGGREWMEVYVAAGPVDLNGLQVQSGTTSMTTKTVEALQCFSLAAGSFAVLGGDAAVADVILPGWSLPNSSTSVTEAHIIIESNGTVIDGVSYPLTSSAIHSGRSYSLDPDATDPTFNDVLGNWCSVAGLGTAGSANPECP
ncbi:MAG: hypothetical protein A2289_08790 [Deltaproteobacteria bacterium RIFOXYA12_FULL_58_15]|nr:MAG: hypothetical protein A2289_08790 [Deltaproteobacteria bacterium RIFOXYA12_FULL_58_15]OGR08384.1 MAG: hypothetical protein A2341_17460 [Deltaproteobacteria bacterium RIFOXYB12_FULL_58_9]